MQNSFGLVETLRSAAWRHRLPRRAIDRAVDMLQNVKGRKAIVLVTDGVDLHSKAFNEADVIRRAKAANVAIWATIGIGEAGKEPAFSTAVMALDKSGSMKETRR